MSTSPDSRLAELLRQLPGVDRMLERFDATAEVPRQVLVAWVRESLAEVRDELRRRLASADSGGQGVGPSVSRDQLEAEVAGRIEARLHERRELALRRVVNASGVLLHTNLGRAPLCARAVRSTAEAASGYVSLELDLRTGRRRSRLDAVRQLLAQVTGAEAATVVHNNAAAVFLALTALARGREVVVSRAHLVEIGGSFRLPDIMEASGARLVEVGTTNRTRLDDYANAFTGDTAMVLKVHPSNFRMVGFTEEVSTAELSALARERNVVCFEDVGSGALTQHGSAAMDEPTVQASLKAGADLVAFSGDKLLGGPQAGILVGRAPWIDRLSGHPVARMVRLDKTDLAALEATLDAYLDPDTLPIRIPLLRMLSRSEPELDALANELSTRLGAALHAIAPEQWMTRVEASTAEVGGGSLPGQSLPSRAVAVSRKSWSPDRMARNWRMTHPAVLGRIESDQFYLDVRGFLDGDLDAIIEAAKEIEQVDGRTG